MAGIERFIAGLEALGLKSRLVGNLVVVTMDIALPEVPGRHDVGCDPPTDFPNVPPHWLHLRSNLALPEGGARVSELGADWRKWSRQHPNWNASLGVRGWAAHARSLLLTAFEA
jgi:hypothetical protein